MLPSLGIKLKTDCTWQELLSLHQLTAASLIFTFLWIIPFSPFKLQALDEQEKALKQQIVHLEKQVKESTPDKAKLKQLQEYVKTHEKGYFFVHSRVVL